MAKAAIPQFPLLEIVVLTSFSRAAGPTDEARFLLSAAFCRLAKSLSHSEPMDWMVGAVGIEPTSEAREARNKNRDYVLKSGAAQSAEPVDIYSD